MSVSAKADRIVSSESEELILVDENDVEVGSSSKALCHDGDGILHRAFSAFIFNERGELLLQQRSASKRLWPLYWSNSCCSHPRRGETLEEAVERRLLEELGITTEPVFVYKFCYQARYGELGSENEFCSVFLGRCDGPVTPNMTEIAATRFIGAENLERELRSSAEKFTPWFKMEWMRLREEFGDELARFAGPDVVS
jgi:isopentenyl-diphosphate delta-isomerase